MGMFDRESNLSSEDWIDQVFKLVNAEYLGTVKSADYGENQKARVEVIPPGQDQPQTFVVFGVLADQISRMETGELPADVQIEKDGRANVFVPAKAEAKAK